MAGGVLVLGLWPAPLADVMAASVDHLVGQITQSKLPGLP
jgi:NADH:ubiquinone oxidoreductase subunit 4 (subunit M)